MSKRLLGLILLSLIAIWVLAAPARAEGERLSLLFLGDNGHHQPPLRFKELAPALAERGIDLTYTDDLKAINAETLADYAGLIVYANIDELPAEQEKALLAYVEEQGKGFIPIHCASYCFRNSDAYVDLVGAQFQRHGTGTFRTKIVAPDHPTMQGFGGFESFDETYVHTRHNEEGRTVLEVREGENEPAEPWTWAREQGKGRVFYTAWGHDSRTFTNPGFVNLIERGIRWAVKNDPAKAPAFPATPAFRDAPQMTELPQHPPETDRMQGKLPFYPAGEKWGTVGDPVTEFQAPLSPEDSQKLYTHPVGFELELVASEPQIGKPIAMNWDERGRLWLLETVDYPNELQPQGQGRDRIRICEDTNDDGKIDQTKIFAEGLSIPTSLTFAHGGVIVHQAPDTLFLRDDDGDDKADVRSVLFTGWSTNDTHAGPSNLVYGLDGWYYGQVGYAGFRGDIAGEERNFRQGFYRFRVAPTRNRQNPLVVSEFEFLRNVNNNAWGVGVSEEGILFGSTANGNPSVHMPIANRYYEAVRGWSPSVLGTIATDDEIHPLTDVVRQVDHHGSFTAAAGHALYTARQYPREWWNRTAFVSEPTGHLTATFTLQPQGSTFVAKNSWNLIAGVDEWQAPIMAEVGPDGSVWIIDWYNIVVQHNPTPAGFETGKGAAYVTDLRDKKHGRIYRLTYKGDATSNDASPSGERRTEVPRAPDATNDASTDSLADATPEQLVAALSDSNFFWRRHAHRLIAEGMAGDVTKALVELVKTAPTDEAGLAPAAMHALWLLDRRATLPREKAVVVPVVERALDHPTSGVRRAAVQTVDDESLDAFLASGVLNDPDPQVRLAAFLRASEFPTDALLAQAVYGAANQPTLSDPWLRDAVTAAAAQHAYPFLATALAAENEAEDFEQRPQGLDVIIARVAEHFARGKPTDELNRLFVAMGQTEHAESSLAAIAEGLEKGLPKQPTAKLSPAADEGLAKAMAGAPADLRSVLVRLGLSLGSEKMESFAGDLVAGYVKQIADNSLDGQKRIFAAQELIAFRPDDDQVVASILKQIQPQTPPDVAIGLLESLSKSQSAAVASGVADRFNSLTPSLRQRALSMLLSRAEWTDRLVTALTENDIPLSDLALDQRQALAAHPDPAIKKRAAQLLMNAGGLPNADRQAAIDAYHAALTEPGDAVRGKELFVKECGKCHKMQGEGTAIGPDLTGMAVHPRHELLIHILDPSRSVEGNFRVYQAVLADGRVRSGLLASETRTSIELVDAEAKRHNLLREDLEELVASSKSLMPEGFEKQLDVAAMTDLLAYMTKRGKYVPLDLSKVASAVSTKGMFYSEDAALERLVFDDWNPKTFEGVPFALVDPKEGRVKNALLMYGPEGYQPPKMPKQVELPLSGPVAALHLLSGVSGWGHPSRPGGTTSLIVRFTYADGQTEDHELKNGVHFADYIRRVDVPESKFAFALSGGQQLRFLTVRPQRSEPLASVAFLKGPDDTAPIIVAATAEMRE
ncbi:MAG TPA: PVC-type heme-binding CxxCH protein [Pirellulaceae bacterium]|nr:PVC-type heme-binding CxxCH protein [Pirellulaceae bacterium]